MTNRLLAAAMALALAAVPLSSANAFFGFGGIVYDPRNHAQNLLTAARSMRQINNQVRQLANEARMIAHQVRDLERLPGALAGELRASLSGIDRLLREAEGLAWEVSAIDAEFRRLFPERYEPSVEGGRILADAREAWALARAGYKHALEVQAGVVDGIGADAALLARLIGESDGAVGNLQAAQAGNRLAVLTAKQSLQLQGLIAAQARAEALDRARALAAREQGRARLARFLGADSTYARD